VGGYFNGKFGFGGTAVQGTDDAFVTMFSSAGTHQFTKTFGDNDAQAVTGVAVPTNGEVIVAGNYKGSFDLGTGVPSVSAGLFDGFLARLNAKGCPTWERTFPGPNGQSTKAIALDPKTLGVALTGSFTGMVEFGKGALTASGDDVFLLSVNP
jgi:hypothetical protein